MHATDREIVLIVVHRPLVLTDCEAAGESTVVPCDCKGATCQVIVEVN